MDKAKDELLEWEEYRDKAFYYVNLSKKNFRLLVTPASKLENELERLGEIS